VLTTVIKKSFPEKWALLFLPVVRICNGFKSASLGLHMAYQTWPVTWACIDTESGHRIEAFGNSAGLHDGACAMPAWWGTRKEMHIRKRFGIKGKINLDPLVRDGCRCLCGTLSFTLLSELDSACSVCGDLPLHVGCRQEETLEESVEAGLLCAILKANPAAAGVADVNGRLPLHLAVAYAKTELVEALLITHPAGASSADDQGNLPLHLLTNLGRTIFSNELVGLESVKVIDGIEGKNLQTRISIDIPCQLSSGCMVLLFQANPAAMGEQNIHGFLPLHMAVANRAGPTVVKALLDVFPSAATVPCAGSTGGLPLHFAVSDGGACLEKVRIQDFGPMQGETAAAILLAHPAAASIPDKDGCFPLHLAVENMIGQMELSKQSEMLLIVKALLRAHPGAASKRCFRKGQTPQEYAEGVNLEDCYPEKRKTVEWLAARLARVNYAETSKRRGGVHKQLHKLKPDEDHLLLSQKQQLERQRVADCNAQLLLQELEEERKNSGIKKKSKRSKRKNRKKIFEDQVLTTGSDLSEGAATGAAAGADIEEANGAPSPSIS